MRRTVIAWDEEPTRLDADPVASLALDRRAWEHAGARFTPVDDGQGEEPGLATATLSTALGTASIGVVDYGEAATYLLVRDTGEQREVLVGAVLDALEAAGALRVAADVLDIAAARPVTLEGQHLAGGHTSALETAGGDDSGPLTAGVLRPDGSVAFIRNGTRITFGRAGTADDGTALFRIEDVAVLPHHRPRSGDVGR